MRQSSAMRAKGIRELRLFMYLIIAILIVGVVVQIIFRGSQVIAVLQAACVLVLFPVSNKIERMLNDQARIDFTASFIADLLPVEATAVIDSLFNAVRIPETVQKATS